MKYEIMKPREEDEEEPGAVPSQPAPAQATPGTASPQLSQFLKQTSPEYDDPLNPIMVKDRPPASAQPPVRPPYQVPSVTGIEQFDRMLDQSRRTAQEFGDKLIPGLGTLPEVAIRSAARTGTTGEEGASFDNLKKDLKETRSGQADWRAENPFTSRTAQAGGQVTGAARGIPFIEQVLGNVSRAGGPIVSRVADMLRGNGLLPSMLKQGTFGAGQEAAQVAGESVLDNRPMDARDAQRVGTAGLTGAVIGGPTGMVGAPLISPRTRVAQTVPRELAPQQMNQFRQGLAEVGETGIPADLSQAMRFASQRPGGAPLAPTAARIDDLKANVLARPKGATEHSDITAEQRANVEANQGPRDSPAAPYYRAAETEPRPRPLGIRTHLDPTFRESRQAVRDDPNFTLDMLQRQRGTGRPVEDSIQFYDAIKNEMNSRIGGLNPTASRSASRQRDTITGLMEAQSPDYAAAQRIHKNWTDLSKDYLTRPAHTLGAKETALNPADMLPGVGPGMTGDIGMLRNIRNFLHGATGPGVVRLLQNPETAALLLGRTTPAQAGVGAIPGVLADQADRGGFTDPFAKTWTDAPLGKTRQEKDEDEREKRRPRYR